MIQLVSYCQALSFFFNHSEVSIYRSCLRQQPATTFSHLFFFSLFFPGASWLETSLQTVSGKQGTETDFRSVTVWTKTDKFWVSSQANSWEETKAAIIDPNGLAAHKGPEIKIFSVLWDLNADPRFGMYKLIVQAQGESLGWRQLMSAKLSNERTNLWLELFEVLEVNRFGMYVSECLPCFRFW